LSSASVSAGPAQSRPSFLFLEPNNYPRWIFPPAAADTTPFAVPHEDYLLRQGGRASVDPAHCLEIARAQSGRFDYIVGESLGGFLWHALFRLAGDQTPFLLVPRINHVAPAQCYALLLSSQLRGPRDIVFAGCRSARQSFGKFGFHCEPRHLPSYDLPGVNLKLFRPLPCRAELRAELGLPAGRDILLYTGRVDRDKHLLELFEVLAAVRTERPVELVVCFHFRGEPYLARCRERAAAIGNIRFVEWPDPETLVRYYNAADLFVSAGVSVCETFGRSPVEAMACGTPSVVSAFNGFRDTITPATGFLVPTVRKDGKGWPQRPDVGSLAATILEALADREALHEKSCAGLKRARRWGRTAILNHVLKLLARDYGGTGSDAPRRDSLSFEGYPPEITALWGDLEGKPLADLVARFVATGELPYEPSRGAIAAFYEAWFAHY
jgi:glycosyltransferase involved in cell wall biosynthesis